MSMAFETMTDYLKTCKFNTKRENMTASSTKTTKELKQAILNEAKIRLESGEGIDPICVLAKELGKGNKSFSREIMEVIYDAHVDGPWVVDTHRKLEIYKEYCEKAGTPIVFSKPILVQGILVYLDNEGDCVLSETAKGSMYAVWTNSVKGRIHIGFKAEEPALAFRNMKPMYSLEATSNRHLKMVVIEEKLFNLDTLMVVCHDLYECTESLKK